MFRWLADKAERERERKRKAKIHGAYQRTPGRRGRSGKTVARERNISPWVTVLYLVISDDTSHGVCVTEAETALVLQHLARAHPPNTKDDAVRYAELAAEVAKGASEYAHRVASYTTYTLLETQASSDGSWPTWMNRKWHTADEAKPRPQQTRILQAFPGSKMVQVVTPKRGSPTIAWTKLQKNGIEGHRTSTTIDRRVGTIGLVLADSWHVVWNDTCNPRSGYVMRPTWTELQFGSWGDVHFCGNVVRKRVLSMRGDGPHSGPARFKAELRCLKLLTQNKSTFTPVLVEGSPQNYPPAVQTVYMTYVPGERLDRAVLRPGLARERRAKEAHLKQLLGQLETKFSNLLSGVQHGDVKPKNVIWVGWQGKQVKYNEVKLLDLRLIDFGNALFGDNTGVQANEPAAAEADGVPVPTGNGGTADVLHTSCPKCSAALITMEVEGKICDACDKQRLTSFHCSSGSCDFDLCRPCATESDKAPQSQCATAGKSEEEIGACKSAASEPDSVAESATNRATASLRSPQLCGDVGTLNCIPVGMCKGQLTMNMGESTEGLIPVDAAVPFGVWEANPSWEPNGWLRLPALHRHPLRKAASERGSCGKCSAAINHGVMYTCDNGREPTCSGYLLCEQCAKTATAGAKPAAQVFGSGHDGHPMVHSSCDERCDSGCGGRSTNSLVCLVCSAYHAVCDKCCTWNYHAIAAANREARLSARVGATQGVQRSTPAAPLQLRWDYACFHSDNAPTHYKNRRAMWANWNHQRAFGVEFQKAFLMNFGCPGEGKGKWDGMGAWLKNMVDRAIRDKKVKITCAKEYYLFAKRYFESLWEARVDGVVTKVVVLWQDKGDVPGPKALKQVDEISSMYSFGTHESMPGKGLRRFLRCPERCCVDGDFSACQNMDFVRGTTMCGQPGFAWLLSEKSEQEGADVARRVHHRRVLDKALQTARAIQPGDYFAAAVDPSSRDGDSRVRHEDNAPFSIYCAHAPPRQMVMETGSALSELHGTSVRKGLEFVQGVPCILAHEMLRDEANPGLYIAGAGTDVLVMYNAVIAKVEGTVGKTAIPAVKPQRHRRGKRRKTVSRTTFSVGDSVATHVEEALASGLFTPPTDLEKGTPVRIHNTHFGNEFACQQFARHHNTKKGTIKWEANTMDGAVVGLIARHPIEVYEVLWADGETMRSCRMHFAVLNKAASSGGVVVEEAYMVEGMGSKEPSQREMALLQTSVRNMDEAKARAAAEEAALAAAAAVAARASAAAQEALAAQKQSRGAGSRR